MRGYKMKDMASSEQHAFARQFSHVDMCDTDSCRSGTPEPCWGEGARRTGGCACYTFGCRREKCSRSAWRRIQSGSASEGQRGSGSCWSRRCSQTEHESQERPWHLMDTERPGEVVFFFLQNVLSILIPQRRISQRWLGGIHQAGPSTRTDAASPTE